MQSIHHLGIVAGAGELPLIACQNAAEKKIPITVFAVQESDLHPELESTAKSNGHFQLISLTALEKTLLALKENEISHLVLLGKVEKRKILNASTMDQGARSVYDAATDRRDDTLFLLFAKKIYEMGIQILPQKTFLESLILPKGVLVGEGQIDPAMAADIEFGYDLAGKLGSLDIGQTAVVFQKMILSLEAIEGTDEAIRRAGQIAQKRGGVVCKRGKVSQDPRFDLPAIGRTTLETMVEAGMRALVFDAANTIMITPEQVLQKAREHGLILVGK